MIVRDCSSIARNRRGREYSTETVLWMNLVTDGLLALALSVEPSDGQRMRRPPRRPSDTILGASAGWWILRIGLLLSLVSLVMTCLDNFSHS